jgi:hypothetical protein
VDGSRVGGGSQHGPAAWPLLLLPFVPRGRSAGGGGGRPRFASENGRRQNLKAPRFKSLAGARSPFGLLPHSCGPSGPRPRRLLSQASRQSRPCLDYLRPESDVPLAHPSSCRTTPRPGSARVGEPTDHFLPSDGSFNPLHSDLLAVRLPPTQFDALISLPSALIDLI